MKKITETELSPEDIKAYIDGVTKLAPVLAQVALTVLSNPATTDSGIKFMRAGIEQLGDEVRKTLQDPEIAKNILAYWQEAAKNSTSPAALKTFLKSPLIRPYYKPYEPFYKALGFDLDVD